MTKRNIADLLGEVEGSEATASDEEAFEQYLSALRVEAAEDESLCNKADSDDDDDPEKLGFIDPTAVEPSVESAALSLEDMVANLDWVWKRDRRSMSRASIMRFDKVRQTLKQILADG